MAARRLTPGGRPSMQAREGIAERLAAEAIRHGATALDIEYKDGYEEVVAARGVADYGIVGFGMAKFRSSSPEAISLRKALYRLVKRKRRITVGGYQYELRGRVYDSFGENAFRVQLRSVPGATRARD